MYDDNKSQRAEGMARTDSETTKILYLDPKISFQEIDRYFFTGCACAYFQIATDTYTNLCYDKGEWDKDILNDGCFSEVFTSQFK